MTTLQEKKCLPCEGGVDPLSHAESEKLLGQLNKWHLSEDGKTITKAYSFKNFYHTMSFVNAIAFIANQENHHPDMEVGYDYCRVTFMTHAIGGLSENDFICAAKIDDLG